MKAALRPEGRHRCHGFFRMYSFPVFFHSSSLPLSRRLAISRLHRDLLQHSQMKLCYQTKTHAGNKAMGSGSGIAAKLREPPLATPDLPSPRALPGQRSPSHDPTFATTRDRRGPAATLRFCGVVVVHTCCTLLLRLRRLPGCANCIGLQNTHTHIHARTHARRTHTHTHTHTHARCTTHARTHARAHTHARRTHARRTHAHTHTCTPSVYRRTHTQLLCRGYARRQLLFFHPSLTESSMVR
jgi:hypothetical protein